MGESITPKEYREMNQCSFSPSVTADMVLKKEDKGIYLLLTRRIMHINHLSLLEYAANENKDGIKKMLHI